MVTKGKFQVNTIKIKQIFADHWDQFTRVNLHKVPKDIETHTNSSINGK